jgi:hypothetical protein
MHARLVVIVIIIAGEEAELHCLGRVCDPRFMHDIRSALTSVVIDGDFLSITYAAFRDQNNVVTAGDACPCVWPAAMICQAAYAAL